MIKILFHDPWGLADLLRGDPEKIKLLEKIGEWKYFYMWGIMQLFAMLLLVHVNRQTGINQ